MDRTQAFGHVVINGKRYFRAPDLANGIDGTDLTAADQNARQEELLAFIEAAGLVPDDDDWAQVLKAARILFGGGGGVLGVSGYMPLPGKVLLQWGSGGSIAGGKTPTLFPTQFPTAVRSIVITEQNAQGWATEPQPTIYGSSAGDRNGFVAYSVRIGRNGVPTYEGGLSYNWMAIGE